MLLPTRTPFQSRRPGVFGELSHRKQSTKIPKLKDETL